MQVALLLLLAALGALLFALWSAFRRLGRSEAYFRSLFENALELITVLDAKGRIVYENPSNEKFVGYGRREMLGQDAFAFFHPDDLPAVKAAFAEALQRPGATPSVLLRMRHKDGGWRWIEAYGNNLLSDPAVRGLVINSRDVTERVQAEARIKELNELRDRFILIVSHQLRTPLSAVRWNLEALATGAYGKVAKAQAGPLRGALAEEIEIIRRINDMLTALDVEEGRVVVRKAPGPIMDVWQEVAEGWKRAGAAKRIRTLIRMPKRPIPDFPFDAEKIREVFAKLTDNAAAYTRRNGRIEARFDVRDDAMRFEIEDDGIGIPLKEQERVFTRFFRASNASTMLPDANGIGLYLAKHFVEAHGGRIGFDTKEGKGSTFWFELPLR